METVKISDSQGPSGRGRVTGRVQRAFSTVTLFCVIL